MTRGKANARMKVDIGRRTHMSRRFLRTNAHICLRSRFMAIIAFVEVVLRK
jgi:hypothetical protein